MENVKRVKSYTDEEKRKIVEEYLASGKSVTEIHTKYNIRGHSKIQEWMVKFGFRKKFERSNQINKYMSDTIGRNVNKMNMNAVLRI
jgi:transposase-like protein